MDLCIFFSVLSVMFSWIICTAQSAPAGETHPQLRHVRNKRCSCATFQDKECVYFCHLDIIWVNTPERVVSYGLGSAPRTRRAAPVSVATGGGGGDARCRCLRAGDSTCNNFCSRESSRSAAVPGALIRSARGKRELAADTSGIKRMRKSNKTRVSPPALRAALKTRLLLEKWRVRRRHRARAWDGESAAS